MNGAYFLTVCLNPTLQKTIVLPRLWENEVNRSREYYLDASGKGINVTRVLTQLGAKAVHLTQAGGRNRDLFLGLAAQDGVDCSPVESNSEIRFCYSLLNREKHTTTEIVEEAEPVETGTEERVYSQFQKLLRECHTLIISGTKATGFSDRLYPQMVCEAKLAGKVVILDLKGDDLRNALPFRPDIIKPNLSEFAATFLPGTAPRESDNGETLLKMVQTKMLELYEQYGTVSVLTRGKYGAFYLDGGVLQSEPAEAIEPLNTIGCGDSFCAGLAAVWSGARNIHQAVRQGMECARKNALLIRPGVIR